MDFLSFSPDGQVRRRVRRVRLCFFSATALVVAAGAIGSSAPLLRLDPAVDKLHVRDGGEVRCISIAVRVVSGWKRERVAIQGWRGDVARTLVILIDFIGARGGIPVAQAEPATVSSVWNGRIGVWRT